MYESFTGLVVFIVAVMWYSSGAFMNTSFLVGWFFDLYLDEPHSPLFNLELICLQFNAPNIWFVHWAACLDTAHSLSPTYSTVIWGWWSMILFILFVIVNNRKIIIGLSLVNIILILMHPKFSFFTSTFPHHFAGRWKYLERSIRT